MTVAATPRKAGPFDGNGITTEFPFDFKVFTKTDVRVVRSDLIGVETDLVLDSDYSVILNSDQDATPGGTVTYDGPPVLPTGWKLTILGAVEYDQGTDITNVGRFNPNVIEQTLDRTTVQIQQLVEGMQRAVQVSPSSAIDPKDLLQNLTIQANEVFEARDQVVEIAATFSDQANARLDEIQAEGDAILAGFTANGDQALSEFDIQAQAALAAGSYLPPVPYGPGLNMTSAFQTVSYFDGVSTNTYAPYANYLPFTTSGAFEAAKFRLLQGISGADVALPGFAGVAGYIESGIGSQSWTVQDRLRTEINIAGSMTPAERTDAAGPAVLDHTAAFLAACTKAGLRGAMIQVPDGWALNIKRVSTAKIWLQCDGSATINALAGATTVGQALLDGDDIRIRGNITINGHNLVDRLLQANQYLELSGPTLKSVLGNTSFFGRLLRAPVGCKLRVSRLTLDDVTGVEDGIEGNTPGAECGIYVESDDFIIEDITATNIGGFEDGDVIRIQLVADPSLIWANVKTGVIRNIRAPEFKKRIVKYQASGGVIDGVFGTSTATDPGNTKQSPYTAVELFGTKTRARNLDITTSRALACIVDNGVDNTIEPSNSFSNAVGTGFTTARGSALSAIRCINAVRTIIDRPRVSSGGTYAVLLSTCNYTQAAIRYEGTPPATQYGIYVDGGAGNTQRGSVLSGTVGTKLAVGVFVAAATYNLAEGNQFAQTTNAIRYFGVVTGSRNRGNILGTGVTNVVDYTGVDTTSAQTIADSDGSVTGSVTSGGTIAVGAVYSQALPWPPVGAGAIVVGGPVTALETGLVALDPITSANTITVRIMNIAASPLAAAARNWRFRTPA